MKSLNKQHLRNLAFAKSIIRWWSINGRALPWRQVDDPFRLLVAEMMLQRSRAGSVAKTYLSLFDTWNHPEDIAQASIDDLEAVLAPLGLKTRAAKIKAVASKWCESEDTPKNAKELQELPGVGPYTANATAVAMSWDSEPCVDSVSIRVLRRFQGIRSTKLSDWKGASRAYSGIPKDQWRDLNWAFSTLLQRCVCRAYLDARRAPSLLNVNGQKNTDKSLFSEHSMLFIMAPL